jgi:L-amino acid N-acyltransferase YncA
VTALELVPVTLADARRFVNEHHGHNEAPIGWKFGVGIAEDGKLVGVAMAGRATGRGIDQYRDVEVTRVCIDRADTYRNAASRLYGAVCRAAAALGYRTAYTYTLAEEDAASVRAAGFVLDAELDARPTWNTPGRARQEETLFGVRLRPPGAKRRWRRDLAGPS